jgi:hypothetical protein
LNAHKTEINHINPIVLLIRKISYSLNAAMRARGRVMGPTMPCTLLFDEHKKNDL